MRACEWCSSDINHKPEAQRFCNLKCSGKYSAAHNDKNPFGKKIPKKERACQECQTTFVPMDSRQKYCSRSCSARFNNRAKVKKERPDCLFCGRKIQYVGRKYCSVQCQGDQKKKLLIEQWSLDPNSTNTKYGLSRTITTYLKEQAGWKCQNPNCCVPGGWSEIHPVTGVVPVEIDHIDGDAYNNHPDNLIVLCPNCHSLTANYRALNKKSGRAYRSEFNQYEKKKNTGES